MIENKLCKCGGRHYGKGLCQRCYQREYRQQPENKLRKKELHKTPKYKATAKKYYERLDIKAKVKEQQHSLKYKAKKREYYIENKEELDKKNMEHYRENKEELNKKQYQYKKQRLKYDIQFKLKETLSTRARMAILNHKGIKKSSSIELLGANIHTVRKHIESQFTDGMSWDNWGRQTAVNNGYNNWCEIDHIKPCDSFDLTDEKQQLICFNYKNLQPLWYRENNHKKNKLDWVK